MPNEDFPIPNGMTSTGLLMGIKRVSLRNHGRMGMGKTPKANAGGELGSTPRPAIMAM